MHSETTCTMEACVRMLRQTHDDKMLAVKYVKYLNAYPNLLYMSQ